ncbi:MAG: spore coat protein YlbD [Bacilli bacterium]
MTKIEEFKAFVKTKPILISYVKNGSMTWQKFYELWALYGTDDEAWNKYISPEEKVTPKQEAFGMNDIFNALKKVDMDSIRKNITGIQKAISLIQEITNKGEPKENYDVKQPYNPRAVYRKFED